MKLLKIILSYLYYPVFIFTDIISCLYAIKKCSCVCNNIKSNKWLIKMKVSKILNLLRHSKTFKVIKIFVIVTFNSNVLYCSVIILQCLERLEWSWYWESISQFVSTCNNYSNKFKTEIKFNQHIKTDLEF